jgi:presenilin-like A22 family membrane protease
MEKENIKDKNEILPIVMMGGLFLLVYALGLLVTAPFQSAGIEPAFENPDDPLNIVYIFIIMMVFTIMILLIAKFWKKILIQLIILGAVGYTSFYAFFLPFFVIIFPVIKIEIVLILSILFSLLLVYALYKYPEWYVVDICGIIVGTSAIVIFGISLGILLVIILLAGLAIYDAISVYKTKHMIDLADTVMDLKLPVLLVVPRIKKYSLLKDRKSLKEKLKENKERDAFFMGLGDIVMPGILVIATYYYSINIMEGLDVLFLPISVIIGTLIGFSVLMFFVIKGKPQAGLPCLCGGAIAGYLVSSYIQFGTFVGINLPF